MNLDHHDWRAIDYPCNQLPGDPAAVLHHAGVFRSTVGHLDQASSSLKNLDAGAMQGKFVPELLEKAGSLARDLDLVRHRYDAAARALKEYGTTLSNGQQEADSALRAASTARQDEDRDIRRARELWQHAKISQDPVERQEYLTASRQLEGRAQTAAGNRVAAKRRVEAAMRARDDAARRAAGVINESIDGSQLNDSPYDKLKDAFDHIARFAQELYESFPALRALVDGIAATVTWIWDNIDTISNVLMVVGFAVSFIPVIGQVLGPILIVLSRIAFAVSIVKSLAGPALKGARTGDWTDLLEAGAMLGANVLLKRALGAGAGRAKNLLKSKLTRAAHTHMDDVARGAYVKLWNKSVATTGTTATAAGAIAKGQHTPVHHPAHDARALLSERGSKADSLLSTFKGTDFDAEVGKLGHRVISYSDPSARAVVADVIDAGVEVGVDSAHRYVKQEAQEFVEGKIHEGFESLRDQSFRRSEQLCATGPGARR